MRTTITTTNEARCNWFLLQWQAKGNAIRMCHFRLNTIRLAIIATFFFISSLFSTPSLTLTQVMDTRGWVELRKFKKWGKITTNARSSPSVAKNKLIQKNWTANWTWDNCNRCQRMKLRNRRVGTDHYHHISFLPSIFSSNSSCYFLFLYIGPHPFFWPFDQPQQPEMCSLCCIALDIHPQ